MVSFAGVCSQATLPSVSSINRILRNKAAERAAGEYARLASQALYSVYSPLWNVASYTNPSTSSPAVAAATLQYQSAAAAAAVAAATAAAMNASTGQPHHLYAVQQNYDGREGDGASDGCVGEGSVSPIDQSLALPTGRMLSNYLIFYFTKQLIS